MLDLVANLNKYGHAREKRGRGRIVVESVGTGCGRLPKHRLEMRE